jgi:predicted transcriptional regulator
MTIPFELQMIHKQSGVQLFSHRFREDIKLDPTLISGFISAVINFSEELKPSDGKEMLKFIDRGDFVLQVEPGGLVIGLLILSSKDNSFKEKLKILVNEFERKYNKEILNWSGFSSCFADFEEEVVQLISSKPLSPYHIPQLVNSDRAPSKIDDIKWAIITKIDGENDINAISEELDISVEVVQGIIAYFEESGLVKTHFKLTDDSVIEITKKGLNALEVGSEAYRELVSEISEVGLKVLSVIGTERTLLEVRSDVSMHHDDICLLIEKLVSSRYIEILPKWKVVLDKKAFHFTRSLEFIDDLFQLIFDESDNWLDNRELDRMKRNTFSLMIIKDESIAKLISEHDEYFADRNNLKTLLTKIGNLETVITRLESLFRVMQSNIEKEIGSNLTKDILTKVHKRLEDDYSELIEQQAELEDMLNWLR